MALQYDSRAYATRLSGQVSDVLCSPNPRDRLDMATHDDTKDQSKAADEAARTARAVTDEAARVGEQTARASADVIRLSTETARNTFQAGLNTATQNFQRITEQVTQVLGF